MDYKGDPDTLLCADPSRGYHALPGFPFVAQHFFERNILGVVVAHPGRLNDGITPKACKVASIVAPLIGPPLSECKITWLGYIASRAHRSLSTSLA